MKTLTLTEMIKALSKEKQQSVIDFVSFLYDEMTDDCLSEEELKEVNQSIEDYNNGIYYTHEQVFGK